MDFENDQTRAEVDEILAQMMEEIEYMIGIYRKYDKHDLADALEMQSREVFNPDDCAA